MTLVSLKHIAHCWRRITTDGAGGGPGSVPRAKNFINRPKKISSNQHLRITNQLSGLREARARWQGSKGSNTNTGAKSPFSRNRSLTRYEDKMHYQETEYGFEWGNAKIERAFSHYDKGWVTFILETDKYSGHEAIQIYVTKTGKVRIHSPEGEWFPHNKSLH